MNNQRSVDILCSNMDLLPNAETVYVDYFGDNITDEEISIIFGVYKCLHEYQGITKDMLHKCFLSNRLDELIHKRNKYRPSGYYKMFKEKGLKIGNTHRSDHQDIDNFEILDDRHCITCGHPDFLTKYYIQNAPPDCYECFEFLCKKCAYYDKTKSSYIHHKCKPNSK